MRAGLRGFAAALGLIITACAAHAAGDAVAGKTAFDNQCAACHTSVVGKNGFGPSLAGVVGRKSGTLAGYAYTPAMTHANLTWDAATLDQFLTSSTAKVPGTSMPVEIADEKTRADTIAYLATPGWGAVGGGKCCSSAEGAHAGCRSGQPAMNCCMPRPIPRAGSMPARIMPASVTSRSTRSPQRMPTNCAQRASIVRIRQARCKPIRWCTKASYISPSTTSRSRSTPPPAAKSGRILGR